MPCSFDAFVLFISIPSEISILSHSSIYNSCKQSSKKTCGMYLPSSSETCLTIIVNIQSFSILFLMVNHHLN